MEVDRLSLIVREYQFSGERLEASEMCPRLTRHWSRAFCRGQQHGLLARLPEKFDLFDRAKLDLLRNYWTVGREREYDQVKNMAMRPGVTEIGCDSDSRFCTALVEALPGLLAVWTVWSDEKSGGTAATMADTQGAAIVQFVRRALGPRSRMRHSFMRTDVARPRCLLRADIGRRQSSSLPANLLRCRDRRSVFRR